LKKYFILTALIIFIMYMIVIYNVYSHEKLIVRIITFLSQISLVSLILKNVSLKDFCMYLGKNYIWTYFICNYN